MQDKCWKSLWYDVGGGGDENFSGDGTIFKLAPDGTFTVLHTFTGGDTDGSEPGAD